MSSSISVAVVGATGYGGAELVGLFADHPVFSPDYLTSRSFSGEPFSSVYPRFTGSVDDICEELSLDRLSDHDLVVFALPHGTSMSYVEKLDTDSTKVVDLAADYRLDDPSDFESVYETEHVDEEGVQEAVYGLTEYFAGRVKSANLVACPGCYPTSSLIPLYGLAQEDLLTDDFFIDAKSGVSGAGRTPSSANTYVNCNETIRPYSVASHRHSPEIREKLAEAGSDAQFSFVPHINAMDHGIEAAIYLTTSGEDEAQDVKDRIRALTEEHELLRYFEEPPGVKPVVKTPYCDLSVQVDGPRAIVFSTLDNLWKGAASQAVQNANLMFDRPHTEGLTSP